MQQKSMTSTIKGHVSRPLYVATFETLKRSISNQRILDILACYLWKKTWILLHHFFSINNKLSKHPHFVCRNFINSYDVSLPTPMHLIYTKFDQHQLLFRNYQVIPSVWQDYNQFPQTSGHICIKIRKCLAAKIASAVLN